MATTARWVMALHHNPEARTLRDWIKAAAVSWGSTTQLQVQPLGGWL
jgi:hypothetical protein